MCYCRIVISFVCSAVVTYTSKEKGDSASPKFIVTLDGVPSPLGNLAECDIDLDEVRPPVNTTEAANREPKVSVLQRLQGGVTSEGVWTRQRY